jgi:hypothetical protein
VSTPVVIDCICPGQAHDSDTVNLRDKLDFQQASACRNAVRLLYGDGSQGAPLEGEILAALTVSYLFVGIESWTLKDEAGKPVPVNRATIADYLMADDVAAETVGDVADGLYSAKVVLPLGVMASRSSRATPTPDSTSAPKASPIALPKPSSPSSTTTTRTADTGKTTKSPGGGSRSSQSSASAA